MRDQLAARTLDAIFTFCSDHKDVFSASALSVQPILSTPRLLDKHQRVIATCVEVGSYETCTTLLERCTGDVAVAAVAAERLAAGMESVRSRITGLIAQVVSHTSCTELVSKIENVPAPLEKLRRKHGASADDFDHLENCAEFLAIVKE